MTCLLDRETYSRWESYFNGNGLPLPARYEMRDNTPAPLPYHPPAPRPPHKKSVQEPRQEPVKSRADRLAKLWTEAEEAEEAARKLRALDAHLTWVGPVPDELDESPWSDDKRSS